MAKDRQDPRGQLEAAVRAVLESWGARKARDYRLMHGISEEHGTAVILQRMVFGNAGGLSGAGVGFTHERRSSPCSPRGARNSVAMISR